MPSNKHTNLFKKKEKKKETTDKEERGMTSIGNREIKDYIMTSGKEINFCWTRECLVLANKDIYK